MTTALVESAWGLSTYDGTLTVRAAHQVPEHPDIDLNLHVQLPPDFDLGTLSEQEDERCRASSKGYRHSSLAP